MLSTHGNKKVKKSIWPFSLSTDSLYGKYSLLCEISLKKEISRNTLLQECTGMIPQYVQGLYW